jgi:ribA/ribD-fused uncharacterized protein
MNRDKLIQAIAEGQGFKFYPFLKGPLSQWQRSPFKVQGIMYLTAEHWMMAEKARTFNDMDTLEKILVSGHPREAKNLGREVKNYNDEKWASVRRERVVEGNIHKFSQNENCLTTLLNTGDKVLVEVNPEDTIWGVGLGEFHVDVTDPRNWRGQNLLGFALMEVRERLRGQ